MRGDWKAIAIGQVCDVVAGQSPKGDSYNSDGAGLPFYQGKKQFSDKYIEEPQTWTTQVTKEADAGDILMSVRAPVGPINFATQKSCIGRGLAAIKATDQIDREYLFYALLFKQSEIKGNEGAVFASINKKQIESIKLPLPLMSEQKRIVAILDEAFAGIDAAIANTEKNLANARELFESYLNSVFDKGKDSWDEVPVEDACMSIIDCVNKTAPKVEGPTPYKMIRTTNIRGGYVDLRSVKYVDEKTYQAWTRRQVPQRGDVILTREAPLGEVGLLETDDKVFLGQRIVSYRPNSNKLEGKFLLFLFQSKYLQFQIHSLASGSTVQHMRVPDSKRLTILLPTLERQNLVVEFLESIRLETHRLEIIYERKLTGLSELKQSLLQKAFSGELTANEADKEIDEAVA